jgi:SMODS and SLOG-associating 2TM effector domain family 5
MEAWPFQRAGTGEFRHRTSDPGRAIIGRQKGVLNALAQREEAMSFSSRDSLLKSLKSTASARFIAASRLEARDRRLTRVTAITSAYVILLTIFPYFVRLPSSVSDIFNLITVGLSVVILVSSLLQYSSGDIVNVEQHHRSALEINEQRRLLLLLPEEAPDAALMPFAERYNGILQKYSVNHSEIDFQKYQTDRPEEYAWMTRAQRAWITTKLFFANQIPNIVLFSITGTMVWLVAFYAYPKRAIAHAMMQLI